MLTEKELEAKYDIAVVGGGPAGCMASIRAARLGKRVILCERNDKILRKLALTGGGRCNLTNRAPIERYVKEFGDQGKFLRSAFFQFSSEDLMQFLVDRQLACKEEPGEKVFPATNRSSSVVEVFRACLAEAKVEVICDMRITEISMDDGSFMLNSHGKGTISAKKVIYATGGIGYQATGSTGDGHEIARRLGHTITALIPGLVPLKASELWVAALQGLAISRATVMLKADKKRVFGPGEILFTHFGLSGPLILDISGDVAKVIAETKKASLSVDVIPDLDANGLERRLLRLCKEKGKALFTNALGEVVPQRLAEAVTKIVHIDQDCRANQLTQKERNAIISILKALPLTIIETLPIDEAMVTIGGVSTKDIDPRTMESRIVPGLYFAGEMIDGAGPSGGFNLQQAFSTGYLAGEKAAHA